MISAKGYTKLAEAESRNNSFIQELLDFGLSTMLEHLEEDREIQNPQNFELYEDYSAFRLVKENIVYYKFQVELTNHINKIKANVLIGCNNTSRQEYLEDYKYEIVKCH